MTTFRPLFRSFPLISFVDTDASGITTGRSRPQSTPRPVPVTGRRELAAAALVGAAELGIVCGYAFLIALVCSAVLGSTP